MPEDHKNMKKIQCWISQDTWDKIVSLGYDSPTIAVTKAFEKLLEDPLNIPEISPNDPRVNPLVSPEYPRESPEIPVYKVKIEGLEMILKEKDKSIERLENDLIRASQDKEDLKNTYNNYFLQVQLLINQKAIGSGSTKKESKPAQKERGYPEKEERVYETIQDESPAIKESPDIEPEVKPEVKQEEKKGIQKNCLNCGKPFTAARSTGLYCSGACKTAYNRNK